MHTSLIVIIAGLFLTLLFLNVYFRAKVLKVYKRLNAARVEFGAAHIFNKERLEKEILPQYPKNVADIKTFVSHIRFSISIAIILVILIIILATILYNYN